MPGPSRATHQWQWPQIFFTSSQIRGSTPTGHERQARSAIDSVLSGVGVEQRMARRAILSPVRQHPLVSCGAPRPSCAYLALGSAGVVETGGPCGSVGGQSERKRVQPTVGTTAGCFAKRRQTLFRCLRIQELLVGAQSEFKSSVESFCINFASIGFPRSQRK